jgi:hypothetical protein
MNAFILQVERSGVNACCARTGRKVVILYGLIFFKPATSTEGMGESLSGKAGMAVVCPR